MKKYAVIILLIFTVHCYAQDNAYLIPRRIYTGDPAVLVIPLPGAAAEVSSPDETGNIVLTPLSQNFPSDPNIDFHRITLERHTSGSRLMIEFTPFITGAVELPEIEIGGKVYYGLTVTVNSLIDNNTPRVLSEPAPSLAMPGTAFMLYGAMTLIVLFLLSSLWFLLKGKPLLQRWQEKFKRWRLFVFVKNLDKRLQKALLKGMDKRIVLDTLSEQFRFFLSYITKINCSTMTAREFEKMPPNLPEMKGYNATFLGKFFHFCDELRFSGNIIDSNDIFILLDDLRLFVYALENAEKNISAGRPA